MAALFSPLFRIGLCLSAILWLNAFFQSVHAARPMMTDDADIVDAKACQLESWLQSYRHRQEYWALPACNLTGNLELTLGGAHLHPTTGPDQSVRALQGKTVLKALTSDSWGLALAAGTSYVSGQGREWYLHAPASLAFRGDRFFLHSSLGWVHDRAARTHRLSWGLGSTAQISERSWLIAESFGEQRGKPHYQVGMRYWVWPERVQIDMTYGDRYGSHRTERWFSVGLRILSDALLP